MTFRTRAVLGVAVLIAVLAVVVARTDAGRRARRTVRARVGVVEQHFADLNVGQETLEAQLHALAARVAELEAKLRDCGCVSPGCAPCPCTADGSPCGHDADQDGVDDCLDGCPCDPGRPEDQGCPPPPPPPCLPCQERGLCTAAGTPAATCGEDADQDGIDDCSDRCPCEPGPADQGGCPKPFCDVCRSCDVSPCGHDADGDTVDDCEDACPCRPGPADHHGCPGGESCTTDADCDDGNGCSLDACVQGTCMHECLCLGPAGFDCCPGPLARCPIPL